MPTFWNAPNPNQIRWNPETFTPEGAQGYPTGEHAINYQFHAERLAREREAALFRDSRQALGQAESLFQAFRPGAAVALRSGLYQNQAQLYLNQASQLEAPDLLVGYREEQRILAERRRRNAARNAQIRQIVGGVVQAVATIAGGPVGAVVGGIANAGIQMTGKGYYDTAGAQDPLVAQSMAGLQGLASQAYQSRQQPGATDQLPQAVATTQYPGPIGPEPAPGQLLPQPGDPGFQGPLMQNQLEGGPQGGTLNQLGPTGQARQTPGGPGQGVPRGTQGPMASQGLAGGQQQGQGAQMGMGGGYGASGDFSPLALAMQAATSSPMLSIAMTLAYAKELEQDQTTEMIEQMVAERLAVVA